MGLCLYITFNSNDVIFQVILGVEGLKQEDEGSYKCVLTNEHGESTHDFNIYVTGIGPIQK